MESKCGPELTVGRAARSPHSTVNPDGSERSRSPSRNGASRILVIDSTDLVRVGLTNIIAAAHRFEVRASPDLNGIGPLIERHHPAMVIADPFEQGRDGMVWTKDFSARFPKTKLLIATWNNEKTFAERALRAGAAGYWMKTDSAASLLRAIETILSGELYFSSSMGLLAMHKLVDRAGGKRDRLKHLSDRELAVFSFIAARHGTGQIAKELGISRKTVETHCAHIKLKLHYANAAALKRGARDSLG